MSAALGPHNDYPGSRVQMVGSTHGPVVSSLARQPAFHADDGWGRRAADWTRARRGTRCRPARLNIHHQRARSGRAPTGNAQSADQMETEMRMRPRLCASRQSHTLRQGFTMTTATSAPRFSAVVQCAMRVCAQPLPRLLPPRQRIGEGPLYLAGPVRIVTPSGAGSW